MPTTLSPRRSLRSIARSSTWSFVAAALLTTSAGLRAAEFREVFFPVVSPDGKLLLNNGIDNVRFYNFATGTTQVEPVSGLPPSGIFHAERVSNNGVVVGEVALSPPNGDDQAVRWSKADGLLNLGNLPGYTSGTALDISADGSVIVGVSENIPEFDRGQAFRWTSATGLQGLGFLNPAAVPISIARAVSDDGSTIIGSSSDALPNPNFFEAAYRWTEATGMLPLGDLPGGADGSAAFAVSADGSVITGVSFSPSGREPFRWTESTGMVGLGFLVPGYTDTIAEDLQISADGATIVGTTFGPGFGEPFIWQQGDGLRSLTDYVESFGIDLGDLQLNRVVGMSSDAKVITGIGRLPNTFAVDFVFVVPEPATAYVLCAGLAAVLANRVSRKRSPS